MSKIYTPDPSRFPRFDNRGVQISGTGPHVGDSAFRDDDWEDKNRAWVNEYNRLKFNDQSQLTDEQIEFRRLERERIDQGAQTERERLSVEFKINKENERIAAVLKEEDRKASELRTIIWDMNHTMYQNWNDTISTVTKIRL